VQVYLRSTLAVVAVLAISSGLGCGPKQTNPKVPPPPPPGENKTCSATVVAPGVPNEQCTGGCPDDLKKADTVITRDCTGEKHDQCPLAKSYVEGCPQLDHPVDPKAKCTVSLKDITACK